MMCLHTLSWTVFTNVISKSGWSIEAPSCLGSFLNVAHIEAWKNKRWLYVEIYENIFSNIFDGNLNYVSSELAYLTYRTAECRYVKLLNRRVILPSFCMRHHFHKARSIVLPKNSTLRLYTKIFSSHIAELFQRL